MWLIVGLGNPGASYAKHRHSIGFMAVDRLADTYGATPFSRKFQGEIAEARIAGERCLLLKPMTYMNLSGQSTGAAAQFYKIPPERIIALHDELDLPFGKLRVKQGGGHGGHNGLKSLDAHIGQDYWRVRLGIGHPGDKELVTGYVLSDFGKEERPALADWLAHIAQAFPLMIAGDSAGFMNTLAPPSSTAKES
jgi:PTH1 family peptidyl-tRNA hydrolase